METFIIKALQLLFSLSILVMLHEIGHFAFARLFKVRVEKFYMFFNPKISLIRAKKINGKWDVKFFAANVPSVIRVKTNANGEPVMDTNGKPVMEQIPTEELPENDWRRYPESTEWGIGWLPLGGYCSISGMVDETKSITHLASEPQPWEYRSRSVWQRLPIITGGVLVNFILAMIIYSAVLFTWGKEYLPLKNANYGLQFSQTMLANGFKNGDKIISIDGQPVEQRADLVEKLLIEGKQKVMVQRDGKPLEIILPSNLNQKILAAEENNFISIRCPYVISEVIPNSIALKAGLMPGDSIVGINGKPKYIFQDITEEMDNCRNTQISLEYFRKGQLLKTTIQLDNTGKLGVYAKPDFEFLKTKKTTYTFLESIPAGIGYCWETLGSYVKQFKLVFTKEGSKQLGGFGSLGKLFPSVWDWQIFWNMTAFLSVILAFMNFLPIPALDGGYVLFLLYEIITGRKPNDKFLEYAQTVGFILLMALLIYANGNDIFKAFFK